jgi:hypothetical protein
VLVQELRWYLSDNCSDRKVGPRVVNGFNYLNSSDFFTPAPTFAPKADKKTRTGHPELHLTGLIRVWHLDCLAISSELFIGGLYG